jgi:hypothetical protein
MKTALPALMAYLLVYWLEGEGFHRLDAAGSGGPNAFAYWSVKAGVFTGMLLLSYYIVSVALQLILDEFFSSSLLFSLNLLLFILFCLVPTAVAALGVRWIRDRRAPWDLGRGREKISPTGSPAALAADEKKKKPMGKWIGLGLLILAAGALSFLGIILLFFLNVDSSFEGVIIFFWVVIPIVITYFAMRAIVRRDLKRASEGK